MLSEVLVIDISLVAEKKSIQILPEQVPRNLAITPKVYQPKHQNSRYNIQISPRSPIYYWGERCGHVGTKKNRDRMVSPSVLSKKYRSLVQRDVIQLVK